MKVRLPKGMGGGPQDMNAMIKQAQKMQQAMEETRAELDTREYTVQAGGGMVTVCIMGNNEIKSITIDPQIVDPDDVETLQDIVTAGVNEALKTVEAANSEAMAKVTGAAGMPGLF